MKILFGMYSFACSLLIFLMFGPEAACLAVVLWSTIAGYVVTMDEGQTRRKIAGASLIYVSVNASLFLALTFGVHDCVQTKMLDQFYDTHTMCDLN